MSPKKNKAARLKKTPAMAGPPPQAQKYSGRIKVNWSKEDVVVINVINTGRATIATDGSGNGSTSLVYGSDLVVTQPAHLAMVLLYEEYRVLGLELEFLPKLENADPGSLGTGAGNAVNDPVAIVPFREDATALTTFQEAASTGGTRFRPANRSCRHSIRADESDYMQYSLVSLPPDEYFGLKTWLAVGGATPSITLNLGTWVATWVVQYRTRRDPAATAAKKDVGERKSNAREALPDAPGGPRSKEPVPQWVLEALANGRLKLGDNSQQRNAPHPAAKPD